MSLSYGSEFTDGKNFFQGTRYIVKGANIKIKRVAYSKQVLLSDVVERAKKEYPDEPIEISLWGCMEFRRAEDKSMMDLEFTHHDHGLTFWYDIP